MRRRLKVYLPGQSGLLGLSCQVNKRTRRMPWHSKAMKDALTCEKPGRGGKGRYSPGYPNGETQCCRALSHHEYIVMRREPGEVKHLSTPRKRHQQTFPE